MRQRGQMEMFGVVAIALLMIIGVVVYMRISSFADQGGSVRDAMLEQEAKSLLITLLSADVPRCGTTVEGVARACLERSWAGACTAPCVELDDILDTVAREGLDRSGWRYNISVEGTPAMAVAECESALRSTSLAVAPRQDIIGTSGIPLGKALTIAVCR